GGPGRGRHRAAGGRGGGAGRRGGGHARLGRGVSAHGRVRPAVLGRARRALARRGGTARRPHGPHRDHGRRPGARRGRGGARARPSPGRYAMTLRARARWAAVLGLAAAALLPPAAARWARARGERELAARDATAAAGYLAIVTPMARSGSGYDLPQLLIRARALAGLPGLAVNFEIYDRTAPPPAQAGGDGPGPRGSERARQPRVHCPRGRDRAGGVAGRARRTARCRRRGASRGRRASRARTLDRAAGPPRGGRHITLACAP